MVEVDKATAPRLSLTGQELPPAHPLVAAGIDAGSVSLDAASAITSVLDRVAVRADPAQAEAYEQILVERAADLPHDLPLRVVRQYSAASPLRWSSDATTACSPGRNESRLPNVMADARAAASTSPTLKHTLPGRTAATSLRDASEPAVVGPDWWKRDRGPTDLSNGVLLCPPCHTRMHDDGWVIRVRDGQVWFIPAPHVDIDQGPRLGGKARYALPPIDSAGLSHPVRTVSFR